MKDKEYNPKDFIGIATGGESYTIELFPYPPKNIFHKWWMLFKRRLDKIPLRPSKPLDIPQTSTTFHYNEKHGWISMTGPIDKDNKKEK